MGFEEWSQEETQPGAGRLSAEMVGKPCRCVCWGQACVASTALGKRREKWEVGTMGDREDEKGRGASLSLACVGTPATLPRPLDMKQQSIGPGSTSPLWLRTIPEGNATPHSCVLHISIFFRFLGSSL